MILEEKIEELNKYCKESLGFTYFSFGWEICSFKDGTLFHFDSSLYKEKQGYLIAETFSGVIDLAYEEMLKDMEAKK